MTVTLNTKSGVLHLSRRCAGQDTRFHFRFPVEPFEDLLWVMGFRFSGLCRKCVHR